MSPLGRLRVHWTIVITKLGIAREVLTFDNVNSHVRAMKWKALVLASVFCVACGSSKNVDPGPGDRDVVGDSDGDGGGDADELPKASVHFIGRHDVSNPARVRADWSATSVYATFEGTGISVRLDGADNYFEVFIDGARTATVHFTPGTAGASAKDVSLASGLASGRHTVQLVRRTEAFLNPSEFLGFTVASGALVATPYPFQRRIEVIGDSITCGYGIEGDNAFCDFSAETENAANTYAAQTARHFNAALSVVAFSGKGMYRDLNFDQSATMPLLYGRTLFNDPTSAWAFASYLPDVVVINLGTNDFANGDPGEDFTTTYIDFIERLENLYPGVEIFCLAGGMQNGVFLTRVQSVVNARRAVGDTRVHYVELPPLQESGAGCDYHPNVATNTAMAAILIEAISEATAW